MSTAKFIYLLCTATLILAGCDSKGTPDIATDTSKEVIAAVDDSSSPLIALTPTEYNNTVRDLLVMPMLPHAWPEQPEVAQSLIPDEGVKNGIFFATPIETPPWPWDFPEEIGVEEFEGMAQGQVPSPYAVEELQKAAMHFATFTLASPVFFACDEWSGSNNGESGSETSWQGAKAILEDNCSECHTSESSGGWYTGSHGSVQVSGSEEGCSGKPRYQCILERIQDGSMPRERNCNVPAVSGDHEQCLNADEIAVIEAWVEGGGLETDLPEKTENEPTDPALVAEQQTCGWKSIERFAQRAWRRPLTEDERGGLQNFWEKNWESSTPDEALVLTAAGVLQSPAFVFRPEFKAATPTDQVSDWEIASRLSYFLWDSMPDPALFAAAAQGELSTSEEIEEQARRMLEDPRARDAVNHFHHQWIGTKHVHHISPARRAYGPLFGITPAPKQDTTDDGEWPGILLPVRHSLEAEVSLFIENTIFDGEGTLEALLSSTRGFASEHTLPIYGEGLEYLSEDPVSIPYGVVVNSIGGLRTLTLLPVEFPPEQRAGLLTMPALLALGAYAVHPAPIIRGKYILERLACQELGTPPPEAQAAQPPDISDAEGTNRERTEAATSPPVCAGCHQSINPPGFAFENYDAMGRWRAEDNEYPVDASGSVTLWGGETFDFDNGVEFAKQLSTSQRVRDCYVVRWARYATGVQLHESDERLEDLKSAFAEDDNIKELLISIATSELFRSNNTGGTP